MRKITSSDIKPPKLRKSKITISQVIKKLKKFFNSCNHDWNIIDSDCGGYVEECQHCKKIRMYP